MESRGDRHRIWRAIAATACTAAGLGAVDSVVVLTSGALALWLLPTNDAERWIGLVVGSAAWWHIGILLAAVGLSLLTVVVLPRDEALATSRRRAMLALTLSLITVAVMVVGAPMLALLVRKQWDDRLHTCLSHVMQLNTALKLYCADADGRLPLGRDWCASLGRYMKQPDALTCPEAEEARHAFALNSGLVATKAEAVVMPGDVVLVFESNAGWNAVGGSEVLPDAPRHVGRDTYGFVDGHAAYIPRKKLPDGSWAKAPLKTGVIWEPVVRESEGEQQPPGADKAH